MTAFDFETCLIQPGLPAPPPVCLSLSTGDLVASDDGWSHMRRALSRLLEQPRIIGFNLCFDVGVWLQWFPEHIDAIFRAYDQDRFLDLKMAERLGEIATGQPDNHHSLATLAARYGLGELDKAGTPRLTYATLLGRPLADYSPAEREYPIKDAVITEKLWHRCRARYAGKVTERAIAAESRHDLWLHLCASWGLKTHVENLEALRRSAHEAVEALRVEAVRNGFIRPNGTKDTKRIKERVKAAYGAAAPLTKTGLKLRKAGKPTTDAHIAINKVALQDSGDPLLESFASYGEWTAVINKDLVLLEQGRERPIHTRYGHAATTRTTSSGPNVQNFRRLEGVRECIAPRDGHCFVFADVGGLELGTLAQVIRWKLGSSHMADLINSGTDLHLYAACRLKGWDYAWAEPIKKKHEEVDQWRQFCKIANFGYPGFMGAATLVPYARQQGVRITLEQAIDLKRNWQRTLPEGPAYLRWIKTLQNPRTGLYDFVIPGSEQILRAGATISSAANGHFQGLGARVMKRIGWRLTREAWTDRTSPLYGEKMIVFVHDEFGYEVRIGRQHIVAERLQTVMREGLHEYLPDVRLDTEPAAMAVWSKQAKTIRDEKGELQIWHP